MLREAELEASDLGAKNIMSAKQPDGPSVLPRAGYRSVGPPVKGFGITSGDPMTKLL
jgi:hypothetical protein